MENRDADLDELRSAGARLRDLDPRRFTQLLQLMLAFVAIYDGNEASNTFLARLAAATPGDRKVSA